MTGKRVFISSVIRGYGAERAAARAAVVSLRIEPVMAEDFGAKAQSPQTACLEGVRSCDVYVGLFGTRYGYVGSSGISATQEEFNEARRRGLPILCFVQDVEKEERQRRFLDDLMHFEEGYQIDRFSTAEDLKLKVVRAINDLFGQPGIKTLGPQDAASHLDKYGWGSVPPGYFGTWLGAVLFPARQGLDYLSPTEMGRTAKQEELLQPALFGASRVLLPTPGYETSEQDEALTFEQCDRSHALARKLSINADGTIVYGTTLGARASDRQRHSTLSTFLIDQDESQTLLAALFAYGQWFYSGLDRTTPVPSLYFGMSLTGIRNRMFGRYPAVEPDRVTIPSHFLDDPLHLPAKPLQIARADLGDSARLAEKVTELVARKFRTVGTYYAGDRR